MLLVILPFTDVFVPIGKGIGAITDGGAGGDVTVIGNTTTNLTATAVTIAINGDLSLTHDADNRANVTLTLGTGASTIGGTLNITNSDACKRVGGKRGDSFATT